MNIKPYCGNERGTVLMLVIISSFILSIIGLAAINLAGLQEIAARAEIDVSRANFAADAGLEYGKLWISSSCVVQNTFPENITSTSTAFSLGQANVGAYGSYVVSITPQSDNDINFTYSSMSVIGTYLISSTSTVSQGVVGTMDTLKNKTLNVRIWRVSPILMSGKSLDNGYIEGPTTRKVH
jgi:Tfp pilus assembly protein PilX